MNINSTYSRDNFNVFMQLTPTDGLITMLPAYILIAGVAPRYRVVIHISTIVLSSFGRPVERKVVVSGKVMPVGFLLRPFLTRAAAVGDSNMAGVL